MKPDFESACFYWHVSFSGTVIPQFLDLTRCSVLRCSEMGIARTLHVRMPYAKWYCSMHKSLGVNATYCAYCGVVIAFKHGTCTSSFTICFPECWLLTAHAFKLSVYRIYMHIHPFAKPLGLVAQSFTECKDSLENIWIYLNIEPTGLCACV